jgi:predicted nuclease of predicted toxin-antitoxin system
MRFLADENVSKLVIGRVLARALEVPSISEAKSGATDTDVVGTADAKGCILITEDRDFGELVIRQRLQIP